HVLDRETRGVDVQPAVVVIVEEPCRKAEHRFDDSRLTGHIGELPLSLRRFVRSLRAVVAEQKMTLTTTGQIEVWPAIVVVVTARDRLDISNRVEAAGGGALSKSAVTVVPVELTAVGIAWSAFVTDK